MTDENDEQKNPDKGQLAPTPGDMQDAAAQVSPASEDPPASTGTLPPLGAEAIADVFNDIAALRAEEPSPIADSLGIKEPSMDFTTSMPQADDPMLVHPAEFPQLTGSSAARPSGNIDLLLDVKLPVSIELGRTTLQISDILSWAQGTIVELDKLAGEPVSLLVNHKLVARGEVVVVDENFGLRITSLVSPRERIEGL